MALLLLLKAATSYEARLPKEGGAHERQPCALPLSGLVLFILIAPSVVYSGLIIQVRPDSYMQIMPTRIANIIYPKELPNGLLTSLIIACLLLGLAALRHGTDLQGWLNVIENWLLMLLIFPTATATVALPFKYRDPTLELKLVYYLGMFVAFLFTLGKLRYWH